MIRPRRFLNLYIFAVVATGVKAKFALGGKLARATKLPPSGGRRRQDAANNLNETARRRLAERAGPGLHNEHNTDCLRWRQPVGCALHLV